MNKVLVKYDDGVEPLKIIEAGDYIDLRSAEDVELEVGKVYKISLGVRMQLPKGYHAVIKPRSSSFKNWGFIQVCSGVIDNKYNGDDDVWMYTFMVMSKGKYSKINKNDRICQFNIVKTTINDFELQTVEELNNPNRGGHGTTGCK